MDRITYAYEAVDQLTAAGNRLARALGHYPNCLKVTHAAVIPCTCGEGLKQSVALEEWDHLTEKFAREGIDYRE